MIILLRLCSALLLVFWMACGAQAEEVIRDYHADITVFADATIEVTETITVNADLPAAEKTSIAEAGKTQTAPRSGKQSNTKFRVKTQGAARSR